VVDMGEDRRVQVLSDEAEDGVGAPGNGVEFLHEVVDSICEDVAVGL
jgi:hypothetical protein